MQFSVYAHARGCPSVCIGVCIFTIFQCFLHWLQVQKYINLLYRLSTPSAATTTATTIAAAKAATATAAAAVTVAVSATGTAAVAATVTGAEAVAATTFVATKCTVHTQRNVAVSWYDEVERMVRKQHRKWGLV